MNELNHQAENKAQKTQIEDANKTVKPVENKENTRNDTKGI